MVVVLYLSLHQWLSLVLIHKYMFMCAPGDNTSARSYDFTKPLKTNYLKRPLNEQADNISKNSQSYVSDQENKQVQSLPQQLP